MQNPTPLTAPRRGGCVMWLAIAALAVSTVGILIDVTQELAWNARMEQLGALATALSQPAPIVEIQATLPPATPAQPAVVIADSKGAVVSTSTPLPTDTPVAVAAAPVNTPVPQTSGITYEQICGVDESNMTDPQLEAFAGQWTGRTFNGWQGWVYDVVDVGDNYNLEIAMEERGLFWSRNIVVENIPNDLALRLNVEQPITFNGRIAKVEYSFEVMCNPMRVDSLAVR